MFSAIDADGGGEIDRVEFGAALARAGVAHAVSEREAGLVFDALDADGSGAISYPEFAALFDAALLGRAMAQAGGGGGVAAGGEVRFGREARGASTQPKLRKQNKNNNNNNSSSSSNNQADRSDADAAAAAAAADDDDDADDDDAARYAPSAITPRSYYDLSRLKQRVAEKIVAKSAASKTAYRSHTQELLNTFQQLDENMDGYLSCADLQTALTSSEGGLNLGCSERQVRALLAAADTDGDQLVSYAEFIDFLSVKDVETSYSPFFDGACASLARSRPTDWCFLRLLRLTRDSHPSSARFRYPPSCSPLLACDVPSVHHQGGTRCGARCTGRWWRRGRRTGARAGRRWWRGRR